MSSTSGPPSGPSDEQVAFGEVGSTIAGRYRVEAILHKGGVTTTVAARHIHVGTALAIQFLSPEFRRDRDIIALFSKQARTMAAIQSEHVLRVVDVGATLSLGTYVVIEHFEGETLDDVLRRGPLPAARAVEYMLQVCKALAVAHAAGVVHRNIKPASLFLARRGEFETLKLIDFFQQGDTSGAVGGAGIGERALDAPAPYRSPEVIRRDPKVDRRADVWSLGATLHQLVTGPLHLAPPQNPARPYVPGTKAAALLTIGGPRISPALRMVVMRCMDPDPARRYQTVDELAAELVPLTTMTEIYRGGLTGVFSRQMMIAAAAQQAASAAPADPRQPARPARKALGEWLRDSALADTYRRIRGSLVATMRDASNDLRDQDVTRRQIVAIAIAIGIGSLLAIGLSAAQDRTSLDSRSGSWRSPSETHRPG